MRPIGIFDSGVGGLTVVKSLLARMPEESLLYLGDTARLPYGTKSSRTVTRYTERNVRFLLDRGVKAVLVACNSASAMALPGFSCPVPIWGVVAPGARRAAQVSRGRVGVIATEATIRSDVYRSSLKALRPELEVTSQACPLFVPLVEEGWENDPISAQVALRYLEPLIAQKIDTLLLGCTHYPLLSPLLSEQMGTDVTLVDSADAVCEEVEGGLRKAGLESGGGPVEHRILVTDSSPRFERIARRILGSDIHLEQVDLLR